jgi:tRNA(fMet)-specific endonuclease VapC
MRYLLDTNTCIAFLKNNQFVVEKVRQIGIRQLCLCAIVKAELWFGACNSEKIIENQQKIKEFFEYFDSLDFDDRAIEHYGEIRAKLSKSGTPIGANDLLISAIAKAHNVTLVTHNTREFKRVDGLLIDDWIV